jgi:hypothetical protein
MINPVSGNLPELSNSNSYGHDSRSLILLLREILLFRPDLPIRAGVKNYVLKAALMACGHEMKGKDQGAR